ncbi:hypothetical protein [Bradyrhizobium diazoefficiens]|uniref:hypothetical protein n=1 Tax=Bradyrhizobium diazoefficiens TaxID=1355477 RepID=UPI000D73BCAC|nr:hypothetical protein [Bradyrhizobium diazoefficiens]AWO90840.1 hypothetical protein DI395_21670 [Bradyrhizobium diazoefficiens]
MHDLWLQVYPWIVSGIGGFIGATILLPTKLGEALIQFRTSKVLEGFKAQQSQELERLKSSQSRELERFREQLSHLGDRGRRSNEMEFAAAEAVWKAFVRAWLSTNTCAGGMMTIPRFSTMSETDLTSFMTSSDLSEREKKQLQDSSDREKEYANILSWRDVSIAGTDIYQARLVLREQRIFMPASLTSEFAGVIEKMSGVQVQRRLALQNPHIPAYEFGKATSDWIGDCVAEFDRLANLANQRLFREERAKVEA